MKTYRFAEFKVDPGSRELFSGDREIHLNDRAFDILLVLIEESPRVLSKDIIVDKVWDGVAVEDNSVERAIVSIRKALGEDTRSPKFIKTVRGRGYHFVGDLTVDDSNADRSMHVISLVSGTPMSPFSVGRAWVFLLALLLTAAVVAALKSDRIMEYANNEVVFRDDFSGKELDQSKWLVSGNSVRLSDGIARITVEEVDRGGRVDSLRIVVDPSRPFTIKSRAKISYNKSVDSNVDFIGTLGFHFGSIDSGNPNLMGVKYANAQGEFCYPGNIVKTEGIYLIKNDGDVRINSHHVEGKIGPQTDAIWDSWFDQELKFSPDDGILSLKINDELKSRFPISETDLLNRDSIHLAIFPLGWWLHHSIEIDYIELSQPKQFG